ncbi:hypothetical protein OG765_13255 [Streptomyces sp. NBC_00555]|uniref:HEAT repeat domain-containing protein n=1 Tax=Streptomyces sp. NBC_00555 TaxID=2903662 RepID=UPI002253D828|nr:HEAT repeat domain-containing protein [Streptomyces sp. NBC_00555]MCX5011950.1 hypothetical protein [Streptomyces sp. NBC_00555]
MTSHIERLVQQLDGEAGESYDARAELIWIGSAAIPAIIDGLPSLGGFGQLTAIEVFQEVSDPRCGPALIGLLDSDNPTVREWAAVALAGLEIDGAAEPLRRAYRACLERATPPDWTEPDGIRWALTELGAPHNALNRRFSVCVRWVPTGTYGCPADCLRTGLRGLHGVEVPAQLRRDLFVAALARQRPRVPFAVRRSPFAVRRSPQRGCSRTRAR